MNQYEIAAVSSSIEGIGAGTVKLITPAQSLINEVWQQRTDTLKSKEIINLFGDGVLIRTLYRECCIYSSRHYLYEILEHVIV